MALPKYFSNLMKSEKAVLASAVLETQKNGIVSTGSCSLDWASGGIIRGAMTLLWGPPGCHAKGTKVLKFEGTFVNVEDVIVGDVLMGPDSRPRAVLELARGREMMYRITPTRGCPFVVNGQHILSLMKCSRNNRDIVNISVNDYLKQPNNFKHHHGLYYSPTISFEKQDKPLPLDPYIFGLWLGDGTSAGPSLTTADKEIADKWTEFGESIGLQCNVYGASNPRNAKSRRLHLTKGERRTNNFSNPLSSVLRELGVLNNKHIPQIYLTSSVEERRALLAGLIDTDGDGSFTKEVTHTSITTKWKHLAEQIEFLAKSLGLYSEINERWSRHEKTAEPKKYWRVSIGGALHEIPTILPHKKFKQKDYELTRLERVTTFSVEEIGEDDFYGFSVNEDHLYVMDGFFVTHNSGKSTFALVLMAKEQERFPDKYAIWIDTEYSFDAARAASLGVDLDRVILFQSNLMEDAIAPLGKMEQEIVKDQSICFIGLDAVKGLTSINEQEQISEGNVESAASAYGGIAKSVNPALNLLVRLSYETKCVTILCNHAMANLDPKTSKYYPYILTGGQKLKHLCSTVIFLNKPARKDALLSSDLKDSSGNAIAVGSTIVAKVNKSRKVVEGRSAEFYWNLQTGEFDKKEHELINLARGLGVLHSPPSRAKLYFGPEKDDIKGSANEWAAKLSADETLYNKIWDACKNTQVMSAGNSLEVSDLVESD